jgi:hypothetical protein
MNAARRSIETILRKLDFDDLLDWAGDKIVNRGRNCVKIIVRLGRRLILDVFLPHFVGNVPTGGHPIPPRP